MGLGALMSRSDPGLKSDSEGPGVLCRSQEYEEQVGFGLKGQERQCCMVFVLVILFVGV